MKSLKTLPTIVGAERILAFVERVVADFKPCRVVLFGSYAYGSKKSRRDRICFLSQQRREMQGITIGECSA